MDNQILDTPNSFYNNQNIPNSTAVLVLGIVSIVMCWCFGIIGLTCGIIALVLAKKGLNLYTSNPDNYTTSSRNNIKAGKICAIIGICLSGLYMAYTIFIFAFMANDKYKTILQELLDR